MAVFRFAHEADVGEMGCHSDSMGIERETTMTWGGRQLSTGLRRPGLWKPLLALYRMECQIYYHVGTPTTN
ncbi:MAG: hypothetical protein ABFS24_07765 [Pseudomonadota bacterium]